MCMMNDLFEYNIGYRSVFMHDVPNLNEGIYASRQSF